ncbi:hypothetical protein [Bradyrhizobium yuanmingense]|uniref:Holliday junction resolvasome RuvABC endonuclease subunit n=1 Tax=Bradyrhizobium yuanmingense TaxID=108015 RepID=A0A1C3XLJ5_9BRAD|nr:hypothetical protein [Bradyrhizobium yuanmingense]MCA1530592.1 hypothetical protein [Bradyrhizobium yuanmingense]TWI16733.1 Holliday junction resolvasome RuvABC endonuclease subunit [Bradyrhizobium yuanmingense]SCB53133.1 Holliday junction resolvasome RuvABC endonuclease subunit [Bradyrhizobium yuanmingense]
MTDDYRSLLVLSIYLNTRGFAFIVFEGRSSPYDWGIRETRGPRKGKKCLLRISQVIDRYAPDVLVIQDTSEQGTRRAGWISKLNGSIAGLAKDRAIPAFAYSRHQVRRAFECYGCPNKQGLAEVIAKHIPTSSNTSRRPVSRG